MVRYVVCWRSTKTLQSEWHGLNTKAAIDVLGA
jgi:hypothetical protein